MNTPPASAEAPSSASPRRRLEVGAAADAMGVVAPAVAIVEGDRLVAIGAPEAIGSTGGAVERHPETLLLPPLVNAHAHLDLTLVPPIPFEGSFAAWAGRVRALRPESPAAIEAAVAAGLARSEAGGTGFIGDIAGRFGIEAADALQRRATEHGIGGVAFVEVFGIGLAERRGIEFVESLPDRLPRAAGGVRLGVSPHAPYSCGDAIYAAAARSGLPATTHLAETAEELRFVRDGDGPLRDLLREVGAWTPDLRGWGCHPVERLAESIAAGGFSLVHLNHLDARALALLAPMAAAGVVAIYCPRASAYFGHPEPGASPHRYRELLALGVPVALGSDAAIVLGAAGPISILDEMRLLWRRDRHDPLALLAMATLHGAAALGVDPALVRLRDGDPAGLLGVELAARPAPQDAAAWLERALEVDPPPRWLWRRSPRR